MYIGPWQEYRLAKIQDDAIQRLRKEWEDQLREQIHGGDDARCVHSLAECFACAPEQHSLLTVWCVCDAGYESSCSR